MFTQISWGSYFTFIGSLTLVYYAFIAYRYYRGDWQKILQAGISLPGKSNRNVNEVFESFVRDTRALISSQANGRPDKDEVIRSMRLLIKKYPEIKDPGLQHLVRNFMYRECMPSIHLSEEELVELWN